ncbi:toprim domain-containing protein [Gammaproteobacteria bacterium]|nr:toprim domain-containing protein [Gammaproteobacteria bacterium]
MNNNTDIYTAFKSAIEKAGIPGPDQIIGDGELQKFSTNGKPKDKAGWYVLHADRFPYGVFGDHRQGDEKYHWKPDLPDGSTDKQKEACRRIFEGLNKKAAEEEKAYKASRLIEITDDWENAPYAEPDHPYLVAKGVGVHGIRQRDGVLIVPMKNADGVIKSFQRIRSVDKRYAKGGEKKGCFHTIGNPDKVLVVVEGYATGASIFEATGLSVIVAFDCGSLKSVAQVVRKMYPAIRMVFAADDDIGTKGNPGKTHAEEAAQAVGGSVVLPDFGKHRPDGVSDFNDLVMSRSQEEVKKQIEAAIAIKPLTPLERLLSKTANGSSQKMRKGMLAEVHILKGVAILGQWSVFYASPNIGKTLITLWLLREQIQAGIISGDNVFYVNADDNYAGSVTKLEIAEEFGMRMLLPDQNGFTKSDVLESMNDLVGSDSAKGTVFILDTLKKFTDLMDKKESTEFGNTARRYVSAGGTLIALAHVNKNKDVGGHSVHAGTSDISDDCDCYYMIEQVGDVDAGAEERTVCFVNGKARGNVDASASFSYSVKQNQSYLDLLNSVNRVSGAELAEARRAAEIEAGHKKDAEIIAPILRKLLADGGSMKTDLINEVAAGTGETKGLVKKVLHRWEGTKSEMGHLWQSYSGDKNTHHYRMTPKSGSRHNAYESAKSGGEAGF